MIDDTELTELVRVALRAETAGVRADPDRLLEIAGPQLPPRRRSGSRRLLPIVAPALAVVVVFVVLVLAGAISGTRRPAAVPGSHRPMHPRLGQPYVAVPSLSQLLAHFAMLRRAQDSADRSWRSPDAGGPDTRVLTRLTHLLARLPGGVRLFVTVERFLGPGSLNQAAGTVSMTIWFVHPGGDTNAFPYSPNVAAFTIRPVAIAGRWVSVIPDGVAKARWTFSCLRAAAGCRAARQGVTLTVPVRGNLVLLPGTTVAGCSGNECMPTGVDWLRPDGTVIRRFDARTLEVGNPQPFPLGRLAAAR